MQSSEEIAITGQITIQVDEVDLQQHKLQNPHISDELLAPAAARTKPKVATFIRQLDRNGHDLQHWLTTTGDGLITVIFNIISKPKAANDY